MAKKAQETTKAQFPAYVDSAISTMRIVGVDPVNYYPAAQECFNRGLAQAGQWIIDHKDEYLAGIREGYEVPSVPAIVREPIAPEVKVPKKEEVVVPVDEVADADADELELVAPKLELVALSDLPEGSVPSEPWDEAKMAAYTSTLMVPAEVIDEEKPKTHKRKGA